MALLTMPIIVFALLNALAHKFKSIWKLKYLLNAFDCKYGYFNMIKRTYYFENE